MGDLGTLKNKLIVIEIRKGGTGHRELRIILQGLPQKGSGATTFEKKIVDSTNHTETGIGEQE